MFNPLDLHRLTSCDRLAHVELHDVLPSTSDLALRRAADASLVTPALVIAAEQSAGRGRGDNRWWSSRGSLTFSLVIEPARLALDEQSWPRFSLAAAVAICDVVAPLVAPSDCGIRWPNDVFVGEKKIAGLLIEAPGAAANVPRRLVIGIGLNVNNSLLTAPVEVRRVGTSLADLTQQSFDLTDVLLSLIEQLEARLEQLASDDADLVQAWQSRCRLRGRMIELADGTAGLCEGISNDGALLIDVDGEPRRIYSGVLTSVGPAAE
jgi:BirA family biotin operon repressor/biotin-[acetyl-CoA-carboxylase] ligase